MSFRRRAFNKEFKLQVVKEYDNGIPVAEICRKYEIDRSLIYKWLKQLKKTPHNPFPGKGLRSTDKAKMAEMERIIGRQALEIDFLKKALNRMKGKNG